MFGPAQETTTVARRFGSSRSGWQATSEEGCSVNQMLYAGYVHNVLTYDRYVCKKDHGMAGLAVIVLGA